MYVDGSEQVAGKADEFVVGWWIPVATEWDAHSLEIKSFPIDVEIPESLESEKKIYLTVDIPILRVPEDRPGQFHRSTPRPESRVGI